MIDEDGLADYHYRSLGTLIEDRIGIQLPPGKKSMVEGRLRNRVRSLGFETLRAYGDCLFDKGALASEFDHIVDLVTTNKTDFFREEIHFSLLADLIVPDLLAGRLKSEGLCLKFWSAASSIGAEAYSMAMVADDVIARHGQGASFSVLATDVNSKVLKTGARAIYSMEMVAPVPAALRQRYVMQARDPTRGEVRIVPELRKHVRFDRVNLMDQHYAVDQNIDVIFCRNVLIYFGKQVQSEIMRRLSSHLRPGGYLFLGHSETSVGLDQPGMRLIRSGILRREA